MKFSKFSHYLQKLENTSKRLEIIDILENLIEQLDENDIDLAFYMSLGYLQASYKSEKFNLAEKMMLRALELAFDKSKEEIALNYARAGDLGAVAENIAGNAADKKLSIAQTHEALLEIAKLSGTGSQDAKIIKTAELLKKVEGLSAKYVVRIILGTMRLGFTELTLLEALVKHLHRKETEYSRNSVEVKKIKKTLENTYYIHPDIGLIAKKFKGKGLEGIKEVQIEVGVPILPQKAQRLPSFEEIIKKMGTVFGEYKFDGTRVQLHMDRSKKVDINDLEQKSLFADDAIERMFIKTFTRNLEETTYQYPDIIEAAEKYIDAESVIVDGEAIGYDIETNEFLPFQQIMQRKRKHGIKEMAEKIPLKYFVFDILYLNGESLTKKPLTERKKLLRNIIKNGGLIQIDESVELSSVSELKQYFEAAREKGLEGLILKKPEAEYEAGARSYTWVKLKVADTKLLDDTVDCVVLGYYFGRGVRAQFGIGGFLVGVYDPDEDVYKTITKVGTGLSDRDWVELKRKADNSAVQEKPKNYSVDKIYTPDVWTLPDIVVELGADEISVSKTHTLGYALRFPRLLNFRDDKRATDTTTPQEIDDLFRMQKRGSF